MGRQRTMPGRRETQEAGERISPDDSEAEKSIFGLVESQESVLCTSGRYGHSSMTTSKIWKLLRWPLLPLGIGGHTSLLAPLTFPQGNPSLQFRLGVCIC